MDLLELLNSETKDKHLTSDEMIRYIYLRVCEFFHYDTRVQYAKLLGDKETYNNILNSHLDVRNIKDKLAICYNLSEDVLKVLIEELACRKADVEDKLGHAYITTTFSNEKYVLDPMAVDISRVKMKLQTKDFCPTNSHLSDTSTLDEMDKKLGYEKYEISELYPITENEDYTKKIGESLDDSICKYNYTDACFMVSTLMHHYYTTNNEIVHETYVSDSYDFHNIYKFINEGRYFDLCKKSGTYVIKELSKEKCRHIVIGKEAYHRNKIFKGY